MIDETSANDASGDPLADDRIQFYLRHRAAIREWASIERDLTAATHQLMVGLIPVVDMKLRELDPEAAVFGEALDGSWPRIVAVRPSWPYGPSGDPLVGVTLEWTPKVDPTGGALPYYGVRVNADTEQGKAVGGALRTLIAGSDAANVGFKAGSYAWWPIQQRLPATPDWWKDTDVFLAGVAVRMATAWQTLVPLVDSAIAAIHAGIADLAPKAGEAV